MKVDHEFLEFKNEKLYKKRQAELYDQTKE
jgi:hypothetical protein